MRFSFLFNEDRPYNGLIDAVSNYVETVIWHRKQKSLYDMLDENHPDYAVFKEEDFTWDIKTLKKEFKNTKFIILDNDEPKISSNIFNIPPIIYQEYKSDLLVLGNSLDNLRYFHSYLNKTNFTVKIIGPCQFPIAEYIGVTSNLNSIRFIDSAEMVMAFDEQVIHNLAARGKIVLTPIDNHYYPKIDTNLNFYGDDLDSWAKRVQRAALNNTYFNRAEELFIKLKLVDLAKAVNNDIEQIRNIG